MFVRQHSVLKYMVCLLVVITPAIYWPLRDCNFINLDDGLYVYENSHVKGGLTLDNLRWAFTQSYGGNCHPLTWLSHMMDCQFWGLNAGAHHLVNVAFHTANSVLFLLVLNAMTGAMW